MAPRARPYMQVDVFNSTSTPFSGNPLAVVLSAEDLSTEEMQRLARWTNLSETTFLLPPTDPEKADYRLRIFSTYREMKFAGHPTLGSCRAWLETGGRPKNPGKIIQECGIGLVTIKQDQASNRLSFAAPALLREGDLSAEDLRTVCEAMGIETNRVLASQWIDNGPGWAGILLESAQDVLSIKRDNIRASNVYNWGAVGAYEIARGYVQNGLKEIPQADTINTNVDNSPHFEVRAFATRIPSLEDPVTGSLKYVLFRYVNVEDLMHDGSAGLAKWLISTGLAPQRYVASQGTCLGRSGRVYVSADESMAQSGDVWIGGETNVCLKGELFL